MKKGEVTKMKKGEVTKMKKVLYGTSEEMVSLRGREIMNEALTRGVEVTPLDGKTAKEGDISDAVGVGLFDDTEKLIVLLNVSAFKNLGLFLDQDQVSVLFLCGKVVLKDLMGVKDKEQFEEPKSYQREEWCAGLLRNMVKNRGIEISPAICKSVVQRVGTDIGVLKFEAMKIAYAASGREVTPQEVLSAISPLNEMGGVTLVEAFFTKSPTHFLKACQRYGENRKTDPTIGITNGLLQQTIVSTLELRLLLDKGMRNISDLAARTGHNPFVLEKTLVPQAQVYSAKNLRGFLGVLYVCERLAKTSVVDAFSAVKTGFLRLMIP